MHHRREVESLTQAVRAAIAVGAHLASFLDLGVPRGREMLAQEAQHTSSSWMLQLRQWKTLCRWKKDPVCVRVHR